MHACGIEGKIAKPKINRPPNIYLQETIWTSSFPTQVTQWPHPYKTWKKHGKIRWSTKDSLGRHWFSAMQNPNKLSSQELQHTNHLSIPELIDTLKNLPRDRAKVFPYKDPDSASKTFRFMRQRGIHKLGIPEPRKIHEFTFRYWRTRSNIKSRAKKDQSYSCLGTKQTSRCTSTFS